MADKINTNIVSSFSFYKFMNKECAFAFLGCY